MDPYLEQYWGDVHHRLCTYACDLLRRSLPPGLIARIDERTIIEDEVGQERTVVPDVRVVERGSQGPAVATMELTAAEPLIIEVQNEPVVEGFVQVIDTRSGGRVITVIEFTSPANKVGKAGRGMYLKKQDELIAGGINLVEIDLIRSGQWIMRCPEEWIPPNKRGLYQVCVTRGGKPWRYEVYPIRLEERLPVMKVPLRPTDPDVLLNLQALIDQVYENGSYGYDVDYTRPAHPPLPQPEARWAAERLQAATKSSP